MRNAQFLITAQTRKEQDVCQMPEKPPLAYWHPEAYAQIYEPLLKVFLTFQ
jgi:hypothetical protein